MAAARHIKHQMDADLTTFGAGGCGADRMHDTHTYTALLRVLSIVNTVLETHRNDPRLRFLQSSRHPEILQGPLRIQVLTDDPSCPDQVFQVRLKNGRLLMVNHGEDGGQVVWRTTLRYLRDVGEHPRQYLDDPDRLQLQWLFDIGRYHAFPEEESPDLRRPGLEEPDDPPIAAERGGAGTLGSFWDKIRQASR